MQPILKRTLCPKTIAPLVAATIPLPMLVNNLAIGILLISILIHFKSLRINSWQVLAITMIPFLIILLSFFNSTNTYEWLKTIERNLGFVIFPIFFALFHKDITKRLIRITEVSFVVSTSIICLVCLTYILIMLIGMEENSKLIWKITNQKLASNINFNSLYLSFFLCFSFFIILNNQSLKKLNVVKIVLLALHLGILVFLGSRMILFCLILISAVLVFNVFKARVGIFLSSIGSLLLCLLIASLVYFSNPVNKWRVDSLIGINDSYLTKNPENGVSLRKELWTTASFLILKNPLFGVGAGDYHEAIVQTYKEYKLRVPYRRELITHNMYLTYGVMFGLTGFFAFFYYILHHVFRFFKKGPILGLIFITLLGLISISESFLFVNKGIIIASFFISLYSHKFDINESE